jgi:DNA-binding NarL/FixJ family response regulator
MATTVLIVDDHDGFRASARTLLERQGVEVVGEAHDGGTALAAAGELEPELVLLDVQLPDADGFEVAERLAALRPAPVVVLTSSRDPSEFGRLVSESRAAGFVPKAELSAGRLRALL